MPSLFLCMHPLARAAVVFLIAVAVLQAVVVGRVRRRLSSPLFVANIMLILLAIWLGSYSLSPLGFSSGRIPLLSGFRITRQQRAPIWIASRQIVLMAPGSAMEIEPQTLPGAVNCMWASSNGGAFDDPASCDTAYAPGEGAAFDILRIAIRSECGLPPAIGEIRVSVLP